MCHFLESQKFASPSTVILKSFYRRCGWGDCNKNTTWVWAECRKITCPPDPQAGLVTEARRGLASKYYNSRFPIIIIVFFKQTCTRRGQLCVQRLSRHPHWPGSDQSSRWHSTSFSKDSLHPRCRGWWRWLLKPPPPSLHLKLFFNSKLQNQLHLESESKEKTTITVKFDGTLFGKKVSLFKNAKLKKKKWNWDFVVSCPKT